MIWGCRLTFWKLYFLTHKIDVGLVARPDSLHEQWGHLRGCKKGRLKEAEARMGGLGWGSIRLPEAPEVSSPLPTSAHPRDQRRVDLGSEETGIPAL